MDGVGGWSGHRGGSTKKDGFVKTADGPDTAEENKTKNSGVYRAINRVIGARMSGIDSSSIAGCYYEGP